MMMILKVIYYGLLLGQKNDTMVNRTDRIFRRPILESTRSWKWRWWNTFYFGVHNKVRINPLPILFVYGMAGVLIDLDHLVIQQIQRVRPFHVEYLIAMGIICFCYNTYAYRCVHKNSLNIGEQNEK